MSQPNLQLHTENDLAGPPQVVDDATAIADPEPINNCPNCTLWLSPGTLACPECNTIVYGRYLRGIAELAGQQEAALQWSTARATWQQALAWVPRGTTQAEAVTGHIAQIEARFRAATDRKALWTRRLGPLAPIVFFLLKAKTFLFALFKLKFLFSFLAFFGLYWALFGWRFGLGFTVGILIHELGHYHAARSRGLRVDLPLFIPGLGAYVRWYNQGVSVETLSAIALAGPLFGGAVAIAFLAVGLRAASPLFLALAYTTAFLNTLNLVPIFGLDGAQATYALNRLQRVLVVCTCLLMYALLREWVYLAIAAGMGWRAFRGEAPEQPSSRGMIVFILLLFALGSIMWSAPDASRGTYGMYPH